MLSVVVGYIDFRNFKSNSTISIIFNFLNDPFCVAIMTISCGLLASNVDANY